MKTTRRMLWFAAVLIAAPAAVQAWWETHNLDFQPLPLVMEIEAEACPGVPVDLLEADPESDGGKGGRAFLLKPGGPVLTAELKDLQPRGLYALYVIARVPEGGPDSTLLTLTVTEKVTGLTASWTMPVGLSPRYNAGGRLYFPTPAGGAYTVSVCQPASAAAFTAGDLLPAAKVSVDPVVSNFVAVLRAKTFKPLRVDRLELRDLLGEIARQPVKKKRILTTDDELASLRERFREELATATDAGKNIKLPSFPEDLNLGPRFPRPAWWTGARTPEEREVRDALLWNLMPDYNTVFSQGHPRLGLVIGHDRNGLIVDSALAYEKTGNLEFGRDAAILLCAAALKWPALDYLVQNVGRGGQGPDHPSDNLFIFSGSPGKFVYRGWSGGTCEKLVRAYDKLFDFINGNEELAKAVGVRIPWVKTSADVRWLLDVYLLEASLDQCKRDWISGGDSLKALIPLVAGPGPVADRMLDTGLFTAMNMNMTFRGGVDDQAVCSYNRDGVHYIGSSGYIGNDLLEIGDLLRKYVAAGGSPRYDILNGTRYPHMRESDATLRSVEHLAGGFPLVIGDARDLRVGRSAELVALPSRLLGGFAATILESGSGTNPLALRAVGLYTGIGRGHSHQDTLNIELFAQGCRVSPDLGGRHEGERRGSPNMRYNKVHNVVEVDDRNFNNETPGSTTSGTGWNTAFSPQPGSQFMEHRARATSHPDVSLYGRQTAWVDADGANSYLFDVFRVRGGAVHTWCFHGGRATSPSNFTVNAPLGPAASADAVDYLRKHTEGTRREGVAPAVVQADWILDAELQKHYQARFFDPAPVVTRMRLFNRPGDRLYVGNISSAFYGYDFPALYARSASAVSNRESVFLSLVEPFAGNPFIRSARALAVKGGPTGADASAALEVALESGATDVIVACSAPAGVGEAEGGLRTDGRFAQVRRDGTGPVLAHLVGGRELRAGGIALTLSLPRYAAAIETTDYDARRFTLRAGWPARLLKGAAALIENPRHHEVFVLESLAPAAGATTITHEKTALYYQSALVNADPAGGRLETEIEPPVYGCDSAFIDGTTIRNEKGDKTWKVRFEEYDRWMDIGFPGYRGSEPVTMTWDDLPDADKDGRKTLKLIGTAKDGTNAAEQVMLTMEVTRIENKGRTFSFKMPENPEYRSGGWQFAYRRMVNEDGSRTWTALYPGTGYRWAPEGAFAADDFADADGDGKAKLRAYLFGPGDTVSVEAFAYAARTGPGLWTVRANAPCGVELPAGGMTGLAVSADGQTFRAIPCTRVEDRLAASLSEADLADGTVTLRLTP